MALPSGLKLWVPELKLWVIMVGSVDVSIVVADDNGLSVLVALIKKGFQKVWRGSLSRHRGGLSSRVIYL